MADDKKVLGKNRAGGVAKPFPWEEAIAEQYERTKSRLKGLATEPEAELQRILEQYLPKKGDSEEEALRKLEDLAMGFAGSTTGKVGNVLVKSTVKDPLRMAFPGIYQRPDVIAAEAASRVAPESPNLKAVFGVTRDDLYEMGKGRKGNLSGDLPGAAAKPRGSEAAARVMTPKNERRLIDTMAEAEKHPELVKGMDPWYVMDPLFQRMEKLLGRERAIEEYTKFNTLMGMASPGSEVLTEIPRGTAAYHLQKQGRFPDFFEFAGVPAKKRGATFPADILNVPGHMYHRTSQALPMQRYLETGELAMDSPKVPIYIEASGVPQTGFQTATPVGDAHWSRAVGLADTRGKAMRKGEEIVPGASVTNPEMTMLAPWWREEIAGKMGLESVPAQARAWGTFSGQTGVTTPIGAPKLELIADKIAETARRLGISLDKARDLVLTGEAYAGKKVGGAIKKAEGGLAPYGIRHSGEGVKGRGYFGPMAGREATVTELSAEDDLGEFPLVVPTLTAEELDRLLAEKEPTPEMVEKASSWAATRRKRGKSPFASPTELRMARPKAEGGPANLTDLPDEVTPANWREHLQTNVLNDARALLGVKDGGVINLDELIEKALKKKDGGVINLDELIEWTLAKAEHRKMKAGGPVKMQGGGNPGEVSGEMFKPKPLTIPEPITDLVEALRRQFEKEKRSMRKPGAAQDVLMRGPVAAYVGAPADILGMGGELLDYAQKKIPALRKPASVMDTGPEKTPPMGYAPAFSFAPEGSYGTTAVQEMMGKAGLMTGEERPLFELAAGVLSPFAVKPAFKTAKAVGKALAPTAMDMLDLELANMMKPYQMAVAPEGKSGKVKAPANPVGFYNPAEKAALNLQRKKGSGSAFISDLKKQPGVTDERIAELGLSDLASNPNVTRDEVIAMTEQNRIPLKESVRRPYDETAEYADTVSGIEDSLIFYRGAVKDVQAEMERIAKMAPNSPLAKQYEEKLATMRSKVDELEAQLDSTKPAKFGPDVDETYSLPGGEDYREIRVRLPVKRLTEEEARVVLNAKPDAKLSDADITYASNQAQERFMHQTHHDDEPNVLFHLRVANHADEEGKRGLLIDELQSDWHQQGREKGYKKELTPEEKKEIKNLLAKKLTVEGQSDADVRRLYELDSKRFGVPNAPFKDNWYQLGLKRAIKEAADTGMDRVYLTTGARQAERYDLSRQLSRVSYQDGVLHGYDNTGSLVVNKAMTPDELPNYVGKDLGKKMVENAAKDAEIRNKISVAMYEGRPESEISALRSQLDGVKTDYEGVDLKVGGEGMKQWYDKTYKNYLEKYAKQHGGKLGETRLQIAPLPGEKGNSWPVFRDWFAAKYPPERGGGSLVALSNWEQGLSNRFVKEFITGLEKNYEPVYYIDITDAMRESAKKGQSYAYGGGVFSNTLQDTDGLFNTDPDKTDAGRIIPDHTI